MLGIFFTPEGVVKWTHIGPSTARFVHFRYPTWFKFFTGVWELLVGIGFLVGLWVPLLAVVAAFLLIVEMLVAIYSHLVRGKDALSQRFHEVIGPWDGSLLVTHMAAVVGRLADDVMTIEGKLALPIENVHLARNIADVLIQAIRLSNFYHVDLEQAWLDLLEEARSGLQNEALVTTMRDTIRQNQQRLQQGS